MELTIAELLRLHPPLPEKTCKQHLNLDSIKESEDDTSITGRASATASSPP